MVHAAYSQPNDDCGPVKWVKDENIRCWIIEDESKLTASRKSTLRPSIALLEEINIYDFFMYF